MVMLCSHVTFVGEMGAEVGGERFLSSVHGAKFLASTGGSYLGLSVYF